MAIAKKHGLKVIEDCAQACGGRYHNGKRLGSIGDIGCFSFNYYKLISCGEGGALTTNDYQLYSRALYLHHPAAAFESKQNVFPNKPVARFNFRLNEIMAALLRVQLQRLEEWTQSLIQIRKVCLEEISSHPLVELPSYLNRQSGIHNYLCFVIPTTAVANHFASLLPNLKWDIFRPIDVPQYMCQNWGGLLFVDNGERSEEHTSELQSH